MSLKRAVVVIGTLAVCAWLIGAYFLLQQIRNALPPSEPLDSAAIRTGPVGIAAAPPLVSVEPRVSGAPASDVRDVVVEEDAVPPNNPSESGPTLVGSPANGQGIMVFGSLEITSRAERCATLDRQGTYNPPNTRGGSSTKDLKAMADDDDWGPAQALLGEQIWLDRTLGRETTETFETMRDYLIRAVRNHNRRSASLLGEAYYRTNKVEASAWWQIEEMMTGRTLTRNAFGQRHSFTSQEVAEGKDRADELLNELGLASALAGPEECVPDDERVARRRDLAASIRRLASRAMQGETSASEPMVFNRLSGFDLVVENVCSPICSPAERVIYYRPEEAAECPLAEASLVTRTDATSSGRYETRQLCVPRFLADP